MSELRELVPVLLDATMLPAVHGYGIDLTDLPRIVAQFTGGWNPSLHDIIPQLDLLERRLRLAVEERPPIRHPQKRRKPQVRPLTARQTEALEAWSTHEGNESQAAKSMRISRRLLREAALKKLGTNVMPKPTTQALRHDRRGQVDVSSDRRSDVGL